VFVSKLKSIAERRVVGDPFAENTTNGAIISQVQFERVLNYIKSGKDEGATVVTGGDQRVGDKGYFLRPTIFTNVRDEMKIAREEIFGPVVAVFKFKDVDEVIRRANQTTYGLAAGVFTNDVNLVLRLANSIDAGTVWVRNLSISLSIVWFRL
jgi:acyl-CoA reductase-like NAD-dependent aldehyde dehydrogenase